MRVNPTGFERLLRSKRPPRLNRWRVSRTGYAVRSAPLFSVNLAAFLTASNFSNSTLQSSTAFINCLRLDDLLWRVSDADRNGDAG
jgi:hypothetical protein